MSQLMSQIRRGAGEAGAVVRSMDFPSLLENHRGEIERALPKHLPVDRIMRIALTAFRKVPAAVAAPFQYTQIIWGVLYGYLVFGDKPDSTLFIGLTIVVGSGLYILYRETVLGRQVAARPPNE